MNSSTLIEGGMNTQDSFYLSGQPHTQTCYLNRRHFLKRAGGRLGPLMRSPFTFKPYGQCGQPVSDVYSHIARHVDDIAFLRSCHVETNVHDQALFQVNTGLTRLGFPSAGSWVTYGLGSENQNLPGY